MASSTLTAAEYLHSDTEIRILKETVTDHCTLHDHDFIEIAYVSSGWGTHTIGAIQSIVSSGDLFIINAHVAHGFTARKGKPLTVYNCIFQPPSIDLALPMNGNFVDIAYYYLFGALFGDPSGEGHIHLTDKGSRQLEPILEDMDLEYRRKDEGYLSVMRADLIRLLIRCFRLYRQDPRRETDFARTVAEDALNYIRTHYARGIRCRDIAARSYLSLSYLSRIFKEATGETIVQALQRIRMQAACLLLETTTLSASEIGQRVGYADLKHFYRLFKRIYGVTPGKYRCENRAK